MKEKNFLKNTEQPEKFDWRIYLKNPENMPKDLATKLDGLADIINEREEEGHEFLEALNAKQFREPVQALVNFFRDIIDDMEERKKFSEAIEKCGSKGHYTDVKFIAPK